MQDVAHYTESVEREHMVELRGEVRFVEAGQAFDIPLALVVTVRAYGTQRGALGEHVEEAIEGALHALGAGAEGIGFDRNEDARLSDELFRARRLGFAGIAIRLTALRALCAPVGGLDAADARTIAFYARATTERPLVVALDEGDERIPAFVMARTLDEIIEAEAAPESEPEPMVVLAPEPEPEPEPELEQPSISLAQVIAQAPEVVVAPTPSPIPVAVAPVAPTNETIPWRDYVDTLEAARGPQTLASFERLFSNAYIPLANAIDRGLAERRAEAARDEFRRTFSRSYSEALPTFALTGKRPRMVLDAFDVAAKMARAHGARTAQVLLVDGMRFDLAAQIAERTTELLEGRAQLADRITLFSALPSSTPRQLEALARGIEALRGTDGERDPEPMRGRTADTVRRVRLGSRDLYKLDVVETTLAAAGEAAIDVIDDVAEDAARAIAKHARAQPAKTLIFVLGDHGFRFDHGAARHGGASPEEVIVSGHAFLVGDVH